MTRRRPTPTQTIDPKNTTPHRMGSVQMGADGQGQLSCQFTVPAGRLCAHGCLLHDLTRVGSEAGRWCAGGVVVVDGDWEVNQVGRQDATAEAHDGRTFQIPRRKFQILCTKSTPSIELHLPPPALRKTHPRLPRRMLRTVSVGVVVDNVGAAAGHRPGGGGAA